MAEPTLARQLASFATSLDYDRLPVAVAGSVTDRILDIIGLCVAARDLPTSSAIMAHVAAQQGPPQARAIGMNGGTSAPLAGLVNGVLAHSLDYDDTHLPSVLHPSASVVPAALATGELADASGRDTVTAVAAGLEVCVRLGMAGFDRQAGASVYFEHGQHATSICGTIGAAVTAALLLQLDEAGVVDAMGIAASMASGVIEANRTGGTVKRLHCGWAAHSGITAAQLARQGFTGPPTVLEGRFGLFQALLRDRADLEQVVVGLGRTWAVPDIFFKPYPANHFTHTAIDAGLGLRARGVTAEEVDSITLMVPAPVIRTIGQPIEVKRAPQTGYQAQFSGPYAVVAGLLGGSGLGVGPADFTDELAKEPTRRELMAKVTVTADPRCDRIFPYQFPAVVRLRTRDGRELIEEVLTNRGSPQRPLTCDELARKFHDNTARWLSPAESAKVERQVRLLPDGGRPTKLMRLLAASDADNTEGVCLP